MSCEAIDKKEYSAFVSTLCRKYGASEVYNHFEMIDVFHEYLIFIEVKSLTI